jgi:curli biogenesis system outer membrane secretion channel CsgG
VTPTHIKDGLRVRTAVVDFYVYAKTYGVPDIGSRAAEMMSTSLFKTRRFDIVERHQIKRVIEEQRFQRSGLVDPATAVRIGKIIGARYVVTGAVTEIGFQEASIFINMTACRVSVDVRLIDVETARVVAAEVGEGRSTRGGVMFQEKTFDAIRKSSMESWISEALRHATEDAARKIHF